MTVRDGRGVGSGNEVAFTVFPVVTDAAPGAQITHSVGLGSRTEQWDFQFEVLGALRKLTARRDVKSESGVSTWLPNMP